MLLLNLLQQADKGDVGAGICIPIALVGVAAVVLACLAQKGRYQ